MVVITKRSYGDYKSGNYGAHTIAVQIGDLEVFFSYDTVVGFHTPQTGKVVSENAWSNTTGKHLNFLEPDKSKRLEYAEFCKKLEEVLAEYGLVVPSKD